MMTLEQFHARIRLVDTAIYRALQCPPIVGTKRYQQAHETARDVLRAAMHDEPIHRTEAARLRYRERVLRRFDRALAKARNA